MGDFHNHCVYVFSQEGDEIRRIGKKGQGIGEFTNPWGIALIFSLEVVALLLS